LLLAVFASSDVVVWAQPRSTPDPALLHQLRALQVSLHWARLGDLPALTDSCFASENLISYAEFIVLFGVCHSVL